MKISISPEVQNALNEGHPVVALESTIISHGMPYPQNVETATAVEAAIRGQGAIPATIAVIQGEIRIGLQKEDLEHLGLNRVKTSILKLSRRDLAYAQVKGLSGATTVAATLACAEAAGISVFATGGIGGVHREAEKTFDISADLHELARTRVAVVCAGAKSILDLGPTLELLETLSVPVVGFGTDFLPAFFSRQSPFRLDCRMDEPKELAAFLKSHWNLKSAGGVLIANPIPQESELPYAQVEKTIEEALSEAEKKGIRGKEVTPFLLASIVSKTQGQSLKANIALIQNNASLAARVAKELGALV